MTVKKLKKCPDCGKEVSRMATTCPHCGRPFVRPSMSTGADSEDGEKGANGGLCFWLGFVFGPMGVLIAAVISKGNGAKYAARGFGVSWLVAGLIYLVSYAINSCSSSNISSFRPTYVHHPVSTSSPADKSPEKQNLPGNVNEGGIKSLFGYEISDVLGDYRTARKWKDGTYVCTKSVKLEDPFKGLKTLTCHYTANKQRLYKISLESNTYAKPDIDKMKSCLKQVSEFFNEKFGEKARMESTENGYAARFANCDYQTFTAEISDGRTRDGKPGKRILISLVDNRVLKTEKRYDR